MRTVKDRVLLLVNSIVGQDEFNTLLENEDICFFNGGLLKKDISNNAVRCMDFGFNPKSLLDVNHYSLIPLKDHTFTEPFHKIENDETQRLQVSVKVNPSVLKKNDWIKTNNDLAAQNAPILEKLVQLIDIDYPVLQIRQEFEEFEGTVNCYIKFGIRSRGGHTKYDFMSSSMNLSDDMVFWQSVTWYLAQFHATYIEAEDIKNDFDEIISSLPPLVTDDEFFTRETKRPFNFPF